MWVRILVIWIIIVIVGVFVLGKFFFSKMIYNELVNEFELGVIVVIEEDVYYKD